MEILSFILFGIIVLILFAYLIGIILFYGVQFKKDIDFIDENKFNNGEQDLRKL